jgi:phage terminase small subunit
MSEQVLTFDEALERLPAKRRVFVLAYLDCLNASEAAGRAKYANPGQQGHRLLKNVEISEVVSLGLQQKAMPKDEVLARLAMLASASLEDFLSLDAEPGADDSEYPSFTDMLNNGITKEDIADQSNPTRPDTKPTPHPGRWRLDLAKAKRRGVLGALKKLKWGEHGPELELHSPEGSLGLLAKHYKLITERQEITGANGAPLMPDTEALRLANEELAQWRRQQTEGLSSLPSAAPIVPTSQTPTDN